jgi:hypothetical protein
MSVFIISLCALGFIAYTFAFLSMVGLAWRSGYEEANRDQARRNKFNN